MKIACSAIIFDLGGVILNIDYGLTKKAFEQLGLSDFDAIYSKAAQSGIFDLFETGQISSARFINHMLDHLPSGTTANQVVDAWNAMLLDLPQKKLDFLLQLKQNKRIFLLSNTNEIHVEKFNRIVHRATGNESLNPYFEKVYFSNVLGMRKPHAETFLHVCAENDLDVATTFFIDDSIQHVEGAREAGLLVHHLQANESILDLF